MRQAREQEVVRRAMKLPHGTQLASRSCQLAKVGGESPRPTFGGNSRLDSLMKLHRLISQGALFTVTAGFASAAAPAYSIQLETISTGFDKKTCWVHARAGAIPGPTPIVGFG